MNKSKSNKIRQAKNLVRKLNRQTAKENAAFEKLKPADKRVYIARDVLAQLKSGRIVATAGTWVDNPATNYVIPEKAFKENVELKSVFDKIKSCNACALGGLFVSAVRIADRLKISEMDHIKNNTHCVNDNSDSDVGYSMGEDEKNRTVFFNDITKYLGRFFSRQQLRLIEIAFEDGTGGVDPRNPIENSARDFFTDYGRIHFTADESGELPDDDRMRLIMENIIVNKGTFSPKKRPQLKMVTPGFIA